MSMSMSMYQVPEGCAAWTAGGMSALELFVVRRFQIGSMLGNTLEEVGNMYGMA